MLRRLKELLGWTKVLSGESPLEQTRVKPRTRAPIDEIRFTDITGLLSIAYVYLDGDETKYLVTRMDTNHVSFAGVGKGIELDAKTPIGARLHLQRLEVPLWLRFVDVEGDNIRCRIERDSGQWRGDVNRFLDPIQLGQELYEIDGTNLKNFEGQRQTDMRWFHGGPQCDVYIWTNEDGTCRLAQIWCRDSLIEWSQSMGLRTGYAVSHEGPAKVGTQDARSYDYHTQIDSALVDLGYRLLSASSVPKSVRLRFKK